MLSKVALSFIIAGLLFSCQSASNAKTDTTVKTKTLTKQKTTSAAPMASNKVSAENTMSKQEQRKLVVYYLHTTFRCPSCNKIERLTKEAVENGFADQIKKGRVEMKVLNIEESGNEHFVDDYKLYTKSVILSDLKNGKEAKWKNLDQVWTLLGNEAKFIEYVQKEIKTYLEG